MSEQRTHHITTSDGVSIGGTVRGQGPPLVLLQGVVGDGDLDWGPVSEHLADRFTCHLPSLRGRGLSGDHPDLSPARRADDVLAYVDSIGEPVGLTGWSSGASESLAVAARSDAVRAVAPFEPVVTSALDEQVQADLGGALADTVRLAAEGRLTEAVRSFLRFPFRDEEIAVADDLGYVEASGRYVENLMGVFQQLRGEDPADEPVMLAAISAPVTVLIGSDTKPLFVACAQYVVDHAPDARIQEVPGVSHAATLTHPAVLAQALSDVFKSHTQRT